MTTSTSTLKVTNYASAATVREWAKAQGLDKGFGTRGKFSAELIKAFNKANAVKYVPGAHKDTVSVEVKVNGRKRTRKVNVADARRVLVENGEDVGKRGRLSTSKLALAVTLAG